MADPLDSDLAAMVDMMGDELPEGCVPTDGIMIIHYLDIDGSNKISFLATNSVTSHLVGLLNMSAHEIMRMNSGGG